MAGMKGFAHICNAPKIEFTQYKTSINNAGYSDTELRRLWEFYVTKSISEKSSLSIKLENYGWENTQSKTTGLPALESLLTASAGNCHLCFIRAKTIKDTLGQMNLANSRICIDHLRGVLKQDFKYEHNENEEVTIESAESRIVCLMRHIRNSFAHGNTYFFPNRNVLLEDRDSGEKGGISARIIIPQFALLKWISIVDRDNILHAMKTSEIS